MDRIDLHIDVARVPPQDILSSDMGTTSEQLKQGVMVGREYASWRRAHENVGTTSQALIDSCHLSASDEVFFEKAARANCMSGRAIVRTLSVARTIADMSQKRSVEKSDLCEALGFRVRDGVGR